MYDDSDVVSVIVQGPHGVYRSTYTVKAVQRYFIDAHGVAQNVGQKQVQDYPAALHSTNIAYESVATING